MSPIGIDLGSYAVKAVQLSRTGGKWNLHAAASITLPVPNHPFDAQTVSHVQDVLHRQGFAGQDVVIAAPASQLEIDVLEVPPRSSGAPIDQIVRSELARAAKLETEPFELDSWDLPAPSRGGAAGTSVMAVALRHTHADALLDPFEQFGFSVLAIDTRAWALARASTTYAAPDGITALVDIGWSSALVVLLDEAGVVIYQRDLRESGLSILLRAIQEAFHLADDEAEFVLRNGGAGADEAQAKQVSALVGRYFDAMGNEIQPAFDYAMHRYADKPIKRLLLAGGGSGIAGVCDLLAKRFSLDATVLSPSRIVECPPNLAQKCADGTLTTALGLAWHGRKK
jgi:type IV pilus assembly protein PilM